MTQHLGARDTSRAALTLKPVVRGALYALPAPTR